MQVFSGRFTAADTYSGSWDMLEMPPGWSVQGGNIVPPPTWKRMRATIVGAPGTPNVGARDNSTLNQYGATAIINAPCLYLTVRAVGMSAGQTGWLVVEHLA